MSFFQILFIDCKSKWTILPGRVTFFKFQNELKKVKASEDSFEIGDGRILIYSSIGVQNSIF